MMDPIHVGINPDQPLRDAWDQNDRDRALAEAARAFCAAWLAFVESTNRTETRPRMDEAKQALLDCYEAEGKLL